MEIERIMKCRFQGNKPLENPTSKDLKKVFLCEVIEEGVSPKFAKPLQNPSEEPLFYCSKAGLVEQSQCNAFKASDEVILTKIIP